MIPRQRSGAIALITIVIISAFALAVIISASITATRGLGSISATKTGEQTFDAAEAGAQDALYRLGSNNNTATFDEPASFYNGGTVHVDIVPNGFRRTIVSRATNTFGNTVRTVTLDVNVSTFMGGFNFAVMAGATIDAQHPNPGFIMDNNSTVRGPEDPVGSGKYRGTKIYLNGNINDGGQGNKNNTTIMGNVFASTLSSWSMQNVKVIDDDFHVLSTPHEFGNIHIQNLVTGTITGTAYVTSHDCGAHSGSTCGAIQSYDSPSVPSDYPISSSDIQRLKNSISGSNIIHGSLSLSSNQTLGETPSTSACNTAPYDCKIDGSVTLTASNITWLIKGSIIWITGDLTLQNPGEIIQLSSALGQNSAVFIVDGKIIMKNSGKALGSGDPKSFVLFISTKSDIVNNVIEAANLGDQAVFFAPNGIIEDFNGGDLNNATGYKIHIDNGATITYNPNISTMTFPPSGPPTPPTTDSTTWREL